MERLGDRAVEPLIANDLETIAEHFQGLFAECVANVRKPNVLVAGVTGSGKSSLINSVFASRVAPVGDGLPVTEHYTRFAPANKPVIIYDSKGLEDGCHLQFIAETRSFFEQLRASPCVADHVHVVWYVINGASGRFEPFEVTLVREVFAPTPVIFVINKADVASAEQLRAIRQAVLREFPPKALGAGSPGGAGAGGGAATGAGGDAGGPPASSGGIYLTVAERKNYAQSWCVRCLGDDVVFSKATNRLACEECGHVEQMGARLGLGELIDITAELLPDLAKEAFLNAQEASWEEKDKFARQIVKQFAKEISIDVAGKALNDIGTMVGKLFVLWGWSFLGSKVSNSLVQDMSEEFRRQELSTRMAMVVADTILRRKLSRSVIASLGIMVNKSLRQLSRQVLLLIEKNGRLDAKDLVFQDASSDQFLDRFMRSAFEKTLDDAIDHYWQL